MDEDLVTFSYAPTSQWGWVTVCH